ncbi:MAG: hypothetical protein M3O34_08300 [Chloroflexota bacterium]|nr:hypothetical protein [Chloroflexota bacterium]
MDGLGAPPAVALGRPPLTRWAIADCLRLAAMLAASASMALLVALAGSTLPDASGGIALHEEAPSVLPVNPLEFCSGEGEQRRCIEEAT